MQNREGVSRSLIALGAVLALLLGAVVLYLGGSHGSTTEEPVEPEPEASAKGDSSQPDAPTLPALAPQPLSTAGEEGGEDGLSPNNQGSADNTGSASSAERRALSGMTAKEELDFLLKSHDRYILAMTDPTATSKRRALAEFGLVSRCVATVLRAQGRADYGDPQELKTRGGFVLRDHPDEWTFAADRALFRFPKGEFPAYDEMQKQTELLDHEGVEYPSSEDWIAGREALFLEALSALGANVPGPR